MNKVAIGIGSNLWDRFQLISTATEHLFKILSELKSSSIYETAPWGVLDQPAFLNSVVIGNTNLPALDLFLNLKKIEKEMGRKERVRYGPREIDLDLLVYGDLILETEKLTVPHLQITEREFVLRPLKEVWAEWEHPVLKYSVTQMWETFLKTQLSTSTVFAPPLFSGHQNSP